MSRYENQFEQRNNTEILFEIFLKSFENFWKTKKEGERERASRWKRVGENEWVRVGESEWEEETRNNED